MHSPRRTLCGSVPRETSAPLHRPIECAVHKHYMIQCGFNNRVAVKLLQFYLTANIALKDLLICGRPQYVYEKNEHYNLGRSS